MAATPETRRIPLSALETIALTLGDLPDVANQWEHLSVDERLGWSLDWGNEMAKLEALADLCSNGVLPPVERRQYEQLVRQIRAALPII